MSEPYQHYIGGEWVSGTGSETFESENPATGETLGEFERGTPEDVESAVDAADVAFDEWRELSRIQRAEYLWDVYHELRERTDELGEIVSKECGKEISEGESRRRRGRAHGRVGRGRRATPEGRHRPLRDPR